MRVAGIDCGTNSIRLLIADIETGSRRLRDHVRLMRVVRLGQDIDKTGRIAPEAMARTLEATRDYARLCEEAGVESIRFVATSASRDAENRGEFVTGVKAALGVEPEIVTGVTEAKLSFCGALQTVKGAAPYLMVDLGGGSTELALGCAEPEQAFSMNVGCVRITERHLSDDPPSMEQIEAAANDVDSALDAASMVVDLGKTATMVGLAGTVTTVTAEALSLPVYDPNAIDGTVLPTGVIRQSCAQLLHMTRVERAAQGYMHPGRVDIIGGGALVWDRVVSRVVEATRTRGAGIETVVTSEHDILDGIALWAAGQIVV